MERIEDITGAVIERIAYKTGTVKYYKDGKLHREDGPAIEKSNGDKKWYKNGKLHREDGPAVKNTDITEWWIKGKLHREDGPAIITFYGVKEWWIKGRRHRDDGPAVEYPDRDYRTSGDKEWWVNGKRHREDGPAIEHLYCKEWYFNGEYIVCTSQSAFIPMLKTKKIEFERQKLIKKIKIDKKLPLLMAGHLQDRAIKKAMRG